MTPKYSDFIYKTLNLDKVTYGDCIDVAAERQLCYKKLGSLHACADKIENLHHCMAPTQKAISHHYLANAYANDRERAEAEGISRVFEVYAHYPKI